MRKILEDFYFGNITPGEQRMVPDSELKRAVDRVTHYEGQLMEHLDESDQAILEKLIQSQHEIDSITAWYQVEGQACCCAKATTQAPLSNFNPA